MITFGVGYLQAYFSERLISILQQGVKIALGGRKEQNIIVTMTVAQLHSFTPSASGYLKPSISQLKSNGLRMHVWGDPLLGKATLWHSGRVAAYLRKGSTP